VGMQRALKCIILQLVYSCHGGPEVAWPCLAHGCRSRLFTRKRIPQSESQETDKELDGSKWNGIDLGRSAAAYCQQRRMASKVWPSVSLTQDQLGSKDGGPRCYLHLGHCK